MYAEGCLVCLSCTETEGETEAQAGDRAAEEGGTDNGQIEDAGGAGEGVGLWTFRRLRRGFGNRLFKVGEDDDGYKVRVKMKYFLRYLAANRDDSPLYVFDGECFR